jgi:hypothetical protein
VEKKEYHVKSVVARRKGSSPVGRGEKYRLECETKREKIEIFAWEIAQGMRQHSFRYSLKFMEST